MALPPGLSTVTVTGTYLHPNGTPYSGRLVFRPEPEVLTSAAHGTLVIGDVEVVLDNNGQFTVSLLATDDPDVTPVGWTYRVTERWYDTPGRSYPLSLPAAAPAVDLADVAPTAPSEGEYVVVTGPAGPAGPAGPEGPEGPQGDPGDPATNLVQSVNGEQGTVSLSAADVGADPAGTATVAVAGHVAAADPHGDRSWADSKFALGSTVSAIDGYLNDALNRVSAIEQGTAWLSALNVTNNAQVTGRLTASGFALPLLPHTSRPTWRDASSTVTLMQANHGWSTSGSGVASSNANDTSQFVKGTQSFAMTTTGTGAVANIRRYGAPQFDLTGKAIRLVFRVADVSRINQINFLVGSSTLANSYSWRVFTHSATAQNQVQSGEWVTVTLQWSGVRSPTGTYTVGPTGVPSATSGFTDMAFQVVDKGTGAATVHLQSVELIDGTVTDFPGGAVSITFDDCYSSVWSLARPKMDSLNYRGTIYTIADVVDTSGVYLTKAQMRSMQDFSGWEIAGHAATVAAHNAKYTTLSTQAVLDELRILRAWMVANGFPSEHFAYPGGWFGPTTDGDPIDQLTARYFSTGRGISSADNAAETVPPGMAYRMRSITGIGSMAGAASPAYPSTMLAAGGPLDRCASTGSWLQLTFHEITSGAATTTNQCSLADFNAIMDGIAARGIKVLPVSDIIRTD
ncbi:polysaccharide deacetylase family protein [Streptomyces azureus]|uniref:Collagen triple helix repeat protein n=1 Tax=Streptomyces azureus TaxID=146537 RepID=A0A0K8PHM4_STRAJ|nr:polysaccharide deacetylase family protein [Streptomyces azureus]GAP46889.1 collagen triple helix repeat protein [Streptomyces azureus]